jgi:hypothetical protein
VAGGRNFGFHSVRLQAHGKLYQDVLAPEAVGTLWQMRISLPGWQYLNFTRAAGADPLSPLMVGGFADILNRCVAAKLPELLAKESQLHTGPMASAAGQGT